MSEYLWDKTGGADEEVERLEALLGGFRHAPRPLELPEGEAPPAPLRSRLFGLPRSLRAPRPFATVGLAAAAAVLLAFLVGAAALLLLRPRVATDNGSAASREARQSQRGSEKEVAPPQPPEQARRTPEPEPRRRAPEPASRAGAVKAGAVGVNDERDAFGSHARATPRRKGLQLASVPKRQQSEPVARGGAGEDFASEAMRGGGVGGASAFVESTRLLTKEQLVYALRLTGAKLRDVRQRARGLDGAKSPPR